ncbi:hypothetical protein H6P81_016420 [Aristolochia fimbriata]|uniref:Uncharacterized protein n=1 Tax=Aristolochia fimbriata TaxID=158543 RepID=A0AAV7E874_ARIFI|nr:hypothetical protein H6P81_016420 [Aristolochia fimbriata]
MTMKKRQQTAVFIFPELTDVDLSSNRPRQWLAMGRTVLSRSSTPLGTKIDSAGDEARHHKRLGSTSPTSKLDFAAIKLDFAAIKLDFDDEVPFWCAYRRSHRCPILKPPGSGVGSVCACGAPSSSYASAAPAIDIFGRHSSHPLAR